jgi:septal ring factor EnvC (AmiA/AmiB activator)
MARLPLISCILMLAFFGAAGTAYAQTREIEEQKKKVEKLEKDISFLDSQIESVKKQKSSTLEELVLIRNKIEGRKSLIAELDRQIIRHNNAIAASQRQIKVLEQRLDTLEMHYRNMIYNAYKHRDTKVWFMYILASESMDQGYRRWSYLKNYSRTINGQAEKIRELKEERTEQLKKLEQLKSNNLKQLKLRTAEYNKLAKEEQQSRAVAQSLKKKQSQYKSQLNKKKQEASRLAKEVERMIAAEIKRQQELERKAKQIKEHNKADPQKQQDIGRVDFEEYTANTKLSGSFSLNKGKLPFPVAQGVVVEQFGIHPHPTLKNVKLPFNNGINISTKPGSGVKAVFDGVVKQVIAIPGYNQCVLVQHGQYFTFYCKLAKVTVKVGDKVSTGETLGNLESGGSTATLHFELWNGTTKQNPELWLKK